MKKILVLICFLLTFIFAKEDYSEMSTQELIAIMGYVKAEDKSKFLNELKLRVATMNANEKKQYQKNLQKLK